MAVRGDWHAAEDPSLARRLRAVGEPRQSLIGTLSYKIHLEQDLRMRTNTLCAGWWLALRCSGTPECKPGCCHGLDEAYEPGRRRT